MQLRRLRNRLLLLAPASVVALFGPAAPPANATQDMWMHFSNSIDGESTDTGHQKDVNVLAWSWGMSRTPGTRSKAAGANVQELSVTKYVDKASPKLMQNLLSGGTIQSATLIDDIHNGDPSDYIRLCLKNVTVEAVSTGGSGGEDKLTENVTFGFQSFTFQYTPRSGSPTPVLVSYDLSARGFGSNNCTGT
jgi:type VI secretion system secreted protein Hcp